MRIKLFRGTDITILQEEVNLWIIENEETCNILEINFVAHYINIFIVVKYTEFEDQTPIGINKN